MVGIGQHRLSARALEGREVAHDRGIQGRRSRGGSSRRRPSPEIEKCLPSRPPSGSRRCRAARGSPDAPCRPARRGASPSGRTHTLLPSCDRAKYAQPRAVGEIRGLPCTPWPNSTARGIRGGARRAETRIGEQERRDERGRGEAAKDSASWRVSGDECSKRACAGVRRQQCRAVRVAARRTVTSPARRWSSASRRLSSRESDRSASRRPAV